MLAIHAYRFIISGLQELAYVTAHVNCRHKQEGPNKQEPTTKYMLKFRM